MYTYPPGVDATPDDSANGASNDDVVRVIGLYDREGFRCRSDHQIRSFCLVY